MLDEDIAIIWQELNDRKLLRGVWKGVKFANVSEDVRDEFRAGICEAIKTINFRDSGQGMSEVGHG